MLNGNYTTVLGLQADSHRRVVELPDWERSRRHDACRSCARKLGHGFLFFLSNRIRAVYRSAILTQSSQSSSIMSTWMDQLNALSKPLHTLAEDLGEEDEEGDSEEEDRLEAEQTLLEDWLFQVCEVVRNAASEDVRDLSRVVNKAQEIINVGLSFAYGSETRDALLEYLPSFALGSSDALVEDPMNTVFGAGRLQILALFR